MDASGNGQSIQQRLDPGRVRQLEQEREQGAILLLQRALSDVSGLVNSLAVLRDNAAAGQPQAAAMLKQFCAELRRCEAAAAGIVLPSVRPPGGN